jgi:hypothetical protein
MAAVFRLPCTRTVIADRDLLLARLIMSPFSVLMYPIRFHIFGPLFCYIKGVVCTGIKLSCLLSHSMSGM